MSKTNTHRASILMMLLLIVSITTAYAQTPTSQSATQSRENELPGLVAQARAQKRPAFSLMPSFSISPTAAAAVTGSGSSGRLSKWTGVFGTNTYTLGDSNIFEDKFGKIGIGTTTPTSLLTVQGMIETTLGGYKFPDGTLQTTAFNPTQVVRSLNGLTGDVQLVAGANITITPAGNTLAIAASNALTGVVHNTTLTGNGTQASPLGVAVPLVLIAPSKSNAIVANGGASNNSGTAGDGLVVTGGTNSTSTGQGGLGIFAIGGNGDPGNAGVLAVGGSGLINGNSGGSAVLAQGGIGFGAGQSSGNGIIARPGFGIVGASNGIAGQFQGDVEIEPLASQAGDLTVSGKLLVSSGIKMFHIDHPLDPENKYLNHAAIESSEVLNIYSGNAQLNENGEALIKLPSWFEALNRDFRYSLTPIGAPGSTLYIAQEVKDNQFKIAGGVAGMKVSWQVAGVRSDPTTHKYKFAVEEEKSERERGYYLNPDAFNQPKEKSIHWARDPERMKQFQQRLEVQQMGKPNQLDR